MAAVSALRAPPDSYRIRTFQWHSDFIDTYGGVLADKVPRLPYPLIKGITQPLWSLVRSISRRCSATLVASAWQVDKLAAHGVPNLVHRPFGIERSIFRADARSFESRRALLALAGRDASDDDVRILVGIGRFAIEKRWDLVIDAFLRVRERRQEQKQHGAGPDGAGPVILILFGDGPERDRMKEHAKPAGTDVVFPGFSKDRVELARNLASADMLVHGCPFETFGLSIAEAMSCGLPCVVPDDGGAAEMHDPASGEIYEANNTEACAAACLHLLDRIEKDQNDALRTAAAKAASKLPSVRQQFEEQIELYTDLIRRRESSGLGGSDA